MVFNHERVSMKKNIIFLLFMVLVSFCSSYTLQQNFSRHLLDDIILRFYHVQRLSRSVNLLLWMSKKKLVPLDVEYRVHEQKGQKILILKDAYIPFSHPRIIWCLEHIQTHHSLFPFLEIWDDLAHYQLVDDQEIIREFIYILFYLYRDVVHQEIFVKNDIHDDQLEEIFKKIANLEKADLEDILDVLDMLVDELPEFIEKYELNSHMTWKEWTKKHWIIPLLAFGALCLKVLVQHFDKKIVK